MRIAFELVGDSVGVNDLNEAAEMVGLPARVVATTTLGTHGPVPVLLAVFEGDKRADRDRVTKILSESMKLCGVEVNHG